MESPAEGPHQVESTRRRLLLRPLELLLDRLTDNGRLRSSLPSSHCLKFSIELVGYLASDRGHEGIVIPIAKKSNTNPGLERLAGGDSPLSNPQADPASGRCPRRDRERVVRRRPGRGGGGCTPRR